MKNAIIQQRVLGMVSTNVYVCMHAETKEAFIVDPADDADEIIRLISAMGAKPCAILLTHGHFDHIGAADALRKRYEIPVYAEEHEKELLASPALNLSGGWADSLTLTADHLLKDGDMLNIAGFTIRVLHTPGHTPGGCCYELVGEDILFSGDTLFYMSVGRTDFPGSSGAAMRMSLHRLLEELSEDTQVLPGHGESTTIGYEKRNNPYA